MMRRMGKGEALNRLVRRAEPRWAGWLALAGAGRRRPWPTACTGWPASVPWPATRLFRPPSRPWRACCLLGSSLASLSAARAPISGKKSSSIIPATPSLRCCASPSGRGCCFPSWPGWGCLLYAALFAIGGSRGCERHFGLALGLHVWGSPGCSACSSADTCCICRPASALHSISCPAGSTGLWKLLSHGQAERRRSRISLGHRRRAVGDGDGQVAGGTGRGHENCWLLWGAVVAYAGIHVWSSWRRDPSPESVHRPLDRGRPTSS
jgi:hypothetical protein